MTKEPGKFQNEPEWVQSLYEECLDGMYDADIIDEEGNSVYGVRVTQDDRLEHGIPDDVSFVALETDNNGLVSMRTMNETEFVTFFAQ